MKLTIEIDPETLRALQHAGTVSLRFVSAHRGRAAATDGYRPGSLPDRFLKAWRPGREIVTSEVASRFKLSRAHASMLLSRLFTAGDIKRPRRGVYVIPEAR